MDIILISEESSSYNAKYVRIIGDNNCVDSVIMYMYTIIKTLFEVCRCGVPSITATASGRSSPFADLKHFSMGEGTRDI